jgi:hypothetical protein
MEALLIPINTISGLKTFSGCECYGVGDIYRINNWSCIKASHKSDKTGGFSILFICRRYKSWESGGNISLQE